ncbi:hypothetical protein LEMLEM_LOCUS25559 [Lemmus lemmus]
MNLKLMWYLPISRFSASIKNGKTVHSIFAILLSPNSFLYSGCSECFSLPHDTENSNPVKVQTCTTIIPCVC